MKTFTGIITSAKMEKTATVSVETRWQHPMYKKTIKKSKKYLAHNEIGAKEGDLVQMVETRPISKLKKWSITAVITKEEASK